MNFCLQISGFASGYIMTLHLEYARLKMAEPVNINSCFRQQNPV